ncbi:MAG: Fe-S-binding domain-containing protein [Chloroflexi bacterium]|nr:MAG: Fe-S-binding domain-containing protein [Chloroflexota bacterium]PIE81541.1 MAG: Fe-S-binding domain-containing protein [Chloroflexota bacterium]
MEQNSIILSVLIFFPLIGVLLILIAGRQEGRENAIKQIALWTSIITFGIAVAVLASYNKAEAGLQLVDRFEWIPFLNIDYFIGVDGISILMVMLTAFISVISIAASWSAIEHQIKAYYIFMLLMEIGMMGVFLAQDLFLFYIFWEFTLIPMYFLIGIWGGKERVYASIKFFLYTMAGSLLMLLAILYMGISNETFALTELIAGRDAFAAVQNILFIGFAVAFAIKVPVFPFHSWLPDAHTQAPTAGSIILAGVLLKMGTYGFVRFNLPLFPEASVYFAPAIAVLAIIGIIYGAIVSFPQKDVKKLVAYSSISHLGFVMLGIFSLNAAGLEGAILQGVNHGLSTGALFFLVGVIYEQRHTREMSEFGGLWKVVPLFTALSLVVVLSSMGLPGLNGFVGEFSILLGSMGAESLGANAWIYTAFATTGVILAAVYLLWMFQNVFMGALNNPKNKKLRDVNGRELAIFIAFLIFIVWIGISPSPYFDLMDSTVSSLVSDIGATVMVGQ